MADKTCSLCAHGKRFRPRKDEIVRYGENVMECGKLNYEGYTQPFSTCNFWAAKGVM
jgi:hypothetical protein